MEKITQKEFAEIVINKMSQLDYALAEVKLNKKLKSKILGKICALVYVITLLHQYEIKGDDKQ